MKERRKEENVFDDFLAFLWLLFACCMRKESIWALLVSSFFLIYIGYIPGDSKKWNVFDKGKKNLLKDNDDMMMKKCILGKIDKKNDSIDMFSTSDLFDKN